MRPFNTIPAVILCGGLGLRLRSVVQDRPKCLAPVNGLPFLHFLLDRLRRGGFTQVILCIGYRGEQVREFAGNGTAWNLAVTYSAETEPLGTAGALKNAERLVHSGSLIVMNGDTILDVNFGELLELHRKRTALATLALVRTGRAQRYGSVSIDPLNRISSFSEKSGRSVEGAETLINGGVYAVSKEILVKIPGAPPPVSLEKDVFPSLIGQGLYGLPVHGYFLDIGIPEDYQRAQTELRC